MALRDRRHAPGLAQYLSMASTVSALSLASFQAITSSDVSISCIVAYNQPMSGCTTTDFTKGNTCSTACVSGITKTQTNIQSACANTRASSQSILGQALLGGLLEVLCPNTGSDNGASNPAVTTQTNVVITTSRAQTTTRTTLTQQTTTTTRARGTTTTSQANTSPTLTFVSSNIVPSTTIETENPPDTTAAPATTQQQQTGAPGSSPTESDTAQATSNFQTDGVGRGSLFDSPIESASGRVAAHWTQTWIISFVLALALLR